MRIIISGAVILLFSSLAVQAAIFDRDPKTSELKVAALQDAAEIDQIVTGRRVTEAQFRNWEKRRDVYRSCEACVLDQPYPGDQATD